MLRFCCVIASDDLTHKITRAHTRSALARPEEMTKSQHFKYDCRSEGTEFKGHVTAGLCHNHMLCRDNCKQKRVNKKADIQYLKSMKYALFFFLHPSSFLLKSLFYLYLFYEGLLYE